MGDYMQRVRRFLFEDSIDMNFGLNIYKESISKDDRFINHIDESILTIEEKYFAYYNLDACINNHPYYYKNKLNNEECDGQVDICYVQTDKYFILNELVKNNAIQIDDANFDILNVESYDNCYKKFISSLKNKALELISKKHNIKPSRYNYIDVGLFDGFSKFEEEIYFERVYIFRYKSIQKKKDFISVFSCYNKKFYQLEFPYSQEYLEYYRLYKRPIEYIPSELLDLYYKDSFKAYKSTRKKLLFEQRDVILKKIKKSLNYESYSMYEDYLNSGIFYFKINRYLKKINTEDGDLKRKIYMAYLTLNYKKESGLFLYDCANLNLLDDKGNSMKIKFLECSYKLKNMRAKKILYDYYSMPINYNPALIKKYS